MAKKLSKKEEYLLNVQDLMDVVPTSTVAKVVRQINDGGKKNRVVKWIVAGYSVHSDLRDVWSISPGDTEHYEFTLMVKDYKKFVEACEKRRAEILEQIKVKKK